MEYVEKYYKHHYSNNIWKYYKQLEGWKVKKFLGEDQDGFPQFLFSKPNKKDLLVEVSQDPEGNGRGFLFISENPVPLSTYVTNLKKENK